jgi:hypothetical protein
VNRPGRVGAPIATAETTKALVSELTRASVG